MGDFALGLGLVRGQDHQQIGAGVAAVFGELHGFGIGPAAGGGDGEGAAVYAIDQKASELGDFVVGEEIELAVAVREQADLTAARDTGFDDIGDAFPVDFA